MTALERIVVKGFKSIKEMDLELRPLNVLIGANGSGKSNLLSVFDLIKHVVTHKTDYFAKKSGGANSLLFFGTKVTNQILVRLDFGDQIGHRYECLLEPTIGDSLVSVSDDFRPQDYATKAPELLVDELRAIDTKFTELMEMWRTYHFGDSSDSAKVKLTGDIHDNHALRSDASNLAAILYLFQRTRRKDYDRILKTLQLVAPFLDDFVLRPVPEKPDTIMLRWRQNDSDLEWHASQLSDGTLRFICLTTLLMQPEPPPLIIIDEPELGLHPYALNLLAALIKSASIHSQIIVATQSAPLVSEFEPEDIVVVEQHNGASIFERRTTDELKNWLEDYSLGILWEKNVLGGNPT